VKKSDLRVGPVISGREFKSRDAGFLDVINPATGRAIGRQACCDPATIGRAVESSAAAFRSAEWQNTTPAARGRLLLTIAELLERRDGEFIELELLDTGKPVSQLKGGELPLAASLLRFYAGAADKIEGSVKNTEGGFFSISTWEPYGVVAGILPWNYPLVNAVMKVAPAIAAGNAIVLKPSAETPLSTVAFGKLCMDAGLPAGIVNVVTGKGSQIGNALVSHPRVGKISFTGSTSVGQAIQKLAADQLKAVNLECGGKNAIIVFADADLERAAQAALISAFINAGQLCVSCSRLLVERSIEKPFAECLRARIRKIVVGDPRDSKTLVGPMITRAQHEIATAALDRALREGCNIIAGHKPLKLGRELSKGFWFAPAILGNVRPGTKTHNDEIFGPVLAMLPFDTEEQAVRISNSVAYGLSGSVWTADGERALRMVKALDTGIIWVNTMLTGYPEIPVPPHRMSGTGVELGMEGLLAYCKRKSAVLGYDSRAPVGWNL